MQVLTTATLSKRGPNTSFFLWFCQLFKNTYFVEDIWTADSQTPARLFKNTPSFTEHRQSLILTFLGFQPATLLKKRLRHRCFCVNFAKFLRTSSDRTPADTGWLLLVFIWEFWEVVQITTEYLCETSYFKYKLLDFNHKIQDSAASRCILVPFERYGRPKKMFFHICFM